MNQIIETHKIIKQNMQFISCFVNFIKKYKNISYLIILKYPEKKQIENTSIAV